MNAALLERTTGSQTGQYSGHTRPMGTGADHQPFDAVPQRSPVQTSLDRIVSVVGKLAQLQTSTEGLSGSLPGAAFVTNTNGSRTISLKLGDGVKAALEISIPAKSGMTRTALEIIGIMDAPPPTTCVVKDASGTVVLAIELPKSDGDSPAITKFDRYSDIRFDSTLQCWVGRTTETESALVPLMKLSPMSVANGRPIEEMISTGRLKRLEGLSQLAARVLTDDRSRHLDLSPLRSVSPETGSLVNVTTAISGAVNLTAKVTEIIARKDGLNELARRNGRADIDLSKGSVTLASQNCTITISGPPHRSAWQKFKDFFDGTPPIQRECVVKSNDGSILLKFRLDSDGKPQSISSLGYRNLDVVNQRCVGVDPAQYASWSGGMEKVLKPAGGFAGMFQVSSAFNPLGMFRAMDLVRQGPPSRALDREEGEAIYQAIVGATRSLRSITL